jgi:hypothetical protein
MVCAVSGAVTPLGADTRSHDFAWRARHLGSALFRARSASRPLGWSRTCRWRGAGTAQFGCADLLCPWREFGGADSRSGASRAVSSGALSENSEEQPWWLGYLDTGADDIVFPDAPMVTVYARWRYVLVEAGPQQAAAWPRSDAGTF